MLDSSTYLAITRDDLIISVTSLLSVTSLVRYTNVEATTFLTSRADFEVKFLYLTSKVTIVFKIFSWFFSVISTSLEQVNVLDTLLYWQIFSSYLISSTSYGRVSTRVRVALPA